MASDSAKNRIEVTPKGLRIPIYVTRSGKTGLTITCLDGKQGFNVGTSTRQLEKFRSKLETLFAELVDKRSKKARSQNPAELYVPPS